jgi:predicted nucleic acid-binding protein
MNAVDTNVLVYYHDQHEPVKQAKAIALLAKLRGETTPTALLWQVLAEFVNQMRSWQDKGRITRPTLIGYAARLRSTIPCLVTPTANALDAALDLTGRFSLSHWDSMILGACKEAGVTTLYTEDMGAPTSYDGLQLINPFV